MIKITENIERENVKSAKSKSSILWKALIFILIIVVIFFAYRYSRSNNTQESIVSENNIKLIDRPAGLTLLADDDALEGNSEAKVTIIEWSDYECPFCARFYKTAYQDIKKEYIDTGKVNLVFRDFPLSFHPQAQKAAEAAECAGEQGKYYEMHDKLFGEGVHGGVDLFKLYAIELGLDSDKFNICLDSGTMAQEVQKDMVAGQANGVRGTPTFIINGKLISGSKPFSEFKQVIDAELAK